MKIVVFPGVGIEKATKKHIDFLNNIKKELNCEGEIFEWEVGHNHPIVDLPYKKIREYAYEVILDFQEIILYAMETKVPYADVYIGHSAGSILALVQKNSPCIIFGSPARLIEFINAKQANARVNEAIDCITKNINRHVFNFVNRYDILSLPLPGNSVENYEYSEPLIYPSTYYPWNAHGSYWKSKKVMGKIVEKINEWKYEIMLNKK